MKLKNIFRFFIFLFLAGGGFYIGLLKILESMNASYSISVCNYLWIIIPSVITSMTVNKPEFKSRVNKILDVAFVFIFPVITLVICYMKNGNLVTAIIGIATIIICLYLTEKIDNHLFKTSYS